MNNIIKSGEVMKLKDLISYEEGSISNLDVVSNDTIKFVPWLSMREPDSLRTVLLATLSILHWKEKQPSDTKEKITNFPKAKISVLIKTVSTV